MSVRTEREKIFMKYENYFTNMTNAELKHLYLLYLEWCKSGVLKVNELGTIRDKYCDMGFSTPLLQLELDLLREIAKRWNM